MLAKVLSTSYVGIQGYPVSVEVDLAPGLPCFHLVGMANTAIREARERVRAALNNSPHPFPMQRITINLAPADIPKQGSYFDLPMAVGILAAQNLVPLTILEEYAIVGELSLDGQIEPIRGALSMALTVRDIGLKGLILPTENYPEAQPVGQIQLIPVDHLQDVIDFLEKGIIKKHPAIIQASPPSCPVDLSQIKGQSLGRRALEIAAAGGHNLLFMGPPGSGKSMLAKALPGILPPLLESEALEVTRIHSSAGLLKSHALITQPPFRRVHHSITGTGLIGGGRIPVPGEISLAHRGILFLDEVTEFKRDLLDLLRQPLEDGQITITRHQHQVDFPAQFILVGAANPCKCGYFGDDTQPCSCTIPEVRRYFQRISGPLLDRIDLQIQVSRVKSNQLFASTNEENSATVRDRVLRVRQIQEQRFSGQEIRLNSQIPPNLLHLYCPQTEKARKSLARAMDSLQLTARGCHQILKIARTVADLRQSEIIDYQDITEAVQFRSCERLYRKLQMGLCKI